MPGVEPEMIFPTTPNTFGRGAGGQATSVAAPIQALTHRFDKNRFPVHNTRRRWTCTVNQISPVRLHVLQPKFGISQFFGGAILNLFSIGTQVDRPNELGLHTRSAPRKLLRGMPYQVRFPSA